MKKKMGILLVMTTMVIGVMSGCGTNNKTAQNTTSQTEQNTTINETTSMQTTVNNETTSETTISAMISEEEAKNIALKDAGVKETDVTILSVKQEIDDGVEEYEVDFKVGTTEYDYAIDAVSGKILEKDVDVEP